MKYCNQPDCVQRKNHTPGFTLIELLVVIALIAILISIMLPTLNKTRYTAQSIVCLSNLRQFAVAETSYAHDNKDQLRSLHSPPSQQTFNYVHPYELNDQSIAQARSYGLPMDTVSCPFVDIDETLQSLPFDEQGAWQSRYSDGAILSSYSVLAGIPLNFDSEAPKYIINQDPELDAASNDSPFPTRLYSSHRSAWPIIAQDISDVEWRYSENRYAPRTFAMHLKKTNALNAASLDGSVETAQIHPADLTPSFSIRISGPSGGGYHHIAAKKAIHTGL